MFSLWFADNHSETSSASGSSWGSERSVLEEEAQILHGIIEQQNQIVHLFSKELGSLRHRNSTLEEEESNMISRIRKRLRETESSISSPSKNDVIGSAHLPPSSTCTSRPDGLTSHSSSSSISSLSSTISSLLRHASHVLKVQGSLVESASNSYQCAFERSERLELIAEGLVEVKSVLK